MSLGSHSSDCAISALVLLSPTSLYLSIGILFVVIWYMFLDLFTGISGTSIQITIEHNLKRNVIWIGASFDDFVDRQLQQEFF